MHTVPSSNIRYSNGALLPSDNPAPKMPRTPGHHQRVRPPSIHVQQQLVHQAQRHRNSQARMQSLRGEKEPEERQGW